MSDFKFAKILAKSPLTFFIKQDQDVEFTTLPSYQDIADLCIQNPAFIPSDETFGDIIFNKDILLNDLDDYIDVYQKKAAPIDKNFLHALDDIRHVMQSYYIADCENYANGVIAQCDNDTKVLEIIVKNLLAISAEAQHSFDSNISQIAQAIAMHIIAEGKIEIEEIEYSAEDEASPSEEFKAALQNEDEENGTIFTIPVNINGERCTVPLTPDGAEILASHITPYNLTISELIEDFKSDSYTLPPFADQILEEASYESKPDASSSKASTAFHEALQNTLAVVENAYERHLDYALREYFNDQSNNTDEDVAFLDSKMEELLVEQKSSNYFAEARLAQTISKAIKQSRDLEDRAIKQAKEQQNQSAGDSTYMRVDTTFKNNKTCENGETSSTSGNITPILH